MLFIATFALVQRLLAAKRDLRLEKELAAAIDRLVHHSVTIEMTGGSGSALEDLRALLEVLGADAPSNDAETQLSEERDALGEAVDPAAVLGGIDEAEFDVLGRVNGRRLEMSIHLPRQVVNIFVIRK